MAIFFNERSKEKVLRELVILFEENLSICNAYVKDFVTCKDITEEDLGPETRIIFHEDAVPSGEHERIYNIPGLSKHA